MLPTAMRFVIVCSIIFPGIAGRAQVTKNAFVGANVTGGYITIYKGSPANNEQLTFIDESFLTVQAQGKYYSNNPYGEKIGPNGASQPVDAFLGNDITTKKGDTIKSVWPEDGFDIVQKVYPVAFSSSGVIVISISIVNHTNTPFAAQAQYLLDNMNSNKLIAPKNANDNPYLIDRYGYVYSQWHDSPPNPLPSFFLAFENPLTSSFLGTVGIGYANDSFPPRPLGLLPLSFLEFGNWPVQGEYTWGPPDNVDRHEVSDVATLMMGQQTEATGNMPGSGDSVTEIFRTAYGTPEWCYQHGNIFGFALYPQHIIWDPITSTYTPNPFQVQTFLFDIGASATSNTTMTQTVSNPIHITSPQPLPSSKDTTQQQNVGSINGDGFVSVNWIDSVLVLPTGCTSSFPVDIHFDVKAGGIDTPIVEAPWDCSITVDCANPDTIPPSFQNSFVGCDSIFFDTVTVQDSREFDLGLDTITYSSKDMTPAQYSVTLSPPPPYNCIDTPVKIDVRQVDTFQAGHVILTFTDCANNVSRDTLCFTAHPPLPDKTAPEFWIDSTVADCHSQCTELNVTDTVKSATSIDRGVDSVVVVSATNMTLSGVPNGGMYPTDTPEVTFHVCVTDSMLDGTIILRASDTSHNFRFDSITYCTTPDVLAPIDTNEEIDPVNGKWHIHVSDSQAWDRGVDSVWLEQGSNLVAIPSPLPYPIGCKRTYDFDVQVVDTSQCASAIVRARDCAGNISSPMPISFPKGAKPVIVASRTVLCSATDSAVLDAGAGFSSYLWSSGQTTRQITVGKGFYFVTVGEGLGCSAISDPVVISDSPAAPQIAPAGPIALCAPDSVLLDAGTGFASYQWLNSGAIMPGITSEKIETSSTGNYSVQVTNSSGCEGTSPAVSVTIFPIPPEPVITSANNVLSSTPGATYQWSLNGMALPGATSQSYAPLTGGSYTVTITDMNGCSSTSEPFGNAGSTLIAVPSIVYAHESNKITIPLSILSSTSLPPGIRSFTAVISFNKTLLVPDGPPPDPGATESAVVGTVNNVVTYTDASSATQGVIANLPFTAALGNDSCTSITIDTFFWNDPNITVTRQNGIFCDTDLCEQGGTRLIDPDGKVTLSAAKPNPAYSSIEIDYELIEQGHTTLIVYDLLGRELLRLVDAGQEPGLYSVDADISMLPAGTYVYSLRTPTIVKSNHLQITR